MTRTFYAVTFSAALALAACNNQSATVDNNTAADDLNAMTPAGNMATEGTNTVGAIDTAFLTDAIKGDNGEVAIGKLAAAKGSSQGVKDFGNMLTNDHGAHKQQLAALAQQAGMAVPDEPSDEAKANLDKLSGLSGSAFDKAFIDAMVEDHQKDIAKYEAQAKSGDPQTAALANQTLPTLRKHLDTAQGLQK
jgi:putative membrane protein